MNEVQQVQPSDSDVLYLTPFTEGLVGLRDVTEISRYMEKFNRLPMQLKAFLKNFNTAVWITDSLAGEFVLSKEQKRAIARIIRLVSLGELPLSAMADTLNSAYEMDPQTAKNVAQKIQFQLLTPVIDEIKMVQRHVGQDAEAISTPKPRPAEGLYENTAPPQARSLPPIPPAGGQPPRLPSEGFRVPDIGQGNVIDLRNQ